MSVCFSGSLQAYSCIQLLLFLFVLCCAGEYNDDDDNDDVKGVVAVALALVLYVGSRSLVEVLDAGLLTRVDVLRVYVDAVELRVNQTNSYISDDAVYLNDVVRTVYGDQMRSELLNLQALVDFFNTGNSCQMQFN